MKTVLLNRFLDTTRQSLGVWQTNIIGELFICKSLELPFKNNEHNISCIPEGEYICKWTRSNRLSKMSKHDVYTYEIQNVPNRAGIRIHSANYFFQLLGCIALGDSHKDINADGELDVIHSGNTVAKFNALMNQEDFKLIITNNFQLAA